MKYYFCYDKRLSGHSVAVKAYARAMEQAGLAVELQPMTADEWKSFDASSLDSTATAIQCFIPPLLKPLPGAKNIAITYHEWTRMPRPWIQKLSKFDDVWVSSRYMEEVLRNSDFNGRCTYLPIPVQAVSEPRKENWDVTPPFTFLSVGEWHFRKGFHLLMEAFRIAFPKEGEAELIIKTSSGVDYRPDHPAVRIINRRMSTAELADLYKNSDAYVTTTLAEGLGLPVAEAMATGLPVLAPTWSGLTEFCGKGRSIEIPFTVQAQPFCSRPDYFAPGQKCGMVDIDECAHLMRQIVLKSENDRKQLALRALKHLEEEFSLEKVAGLISAHLQI